MPPLLLALALVGGWDYAGFADEPGRPAPAPAPAPTPDRRPGRIDDAIFPPAWPRPAAPATRWRVTDIAGETFEHADKAYLEAWLVLHNAELARARR